MREVLFSLNTVAMNPTNEPEEKPSNKELAADETIFHAGSEVDQFETNDSSLTYIEDTATESGATVQLDAEDPHKTIDADVDPSFLNAEDPHRTMDADVDPSFLNPDTQVTINEDRLITLTDFDQKDGGESVQMQIQDAKYQELKELGKGGMGKVSLWRDHSLNRMVATKQLLASNASDDILRRFCEEAQITGQLEHPNIIPIHDLGVDDQGHLYFTMKHVKGKTLNDILIDTKKHGEVDYSLNKLLQIFLGICYAVDYAHSRDVIHRDLKPENIMIGDFNEVMVMDWGLAKVIGQGHEIVDSGGVTTIRTEGGFKTIDGKIAGTPVYMSPEQAQGNLEELDARSDIYSLGCILYEIIYGEKTVAGESIFDTLAHVTSGNVKSIGPSGLFGKVPRELQKIISTAISFKAEERYQTTRDFANDIERFLEGKEVSVYQYSLSERTGRLMSKYRKEIALVLLPFLALIPLLYFWNAAAAKSKANTASDSGSKLLTAEVVTKGFDRLEKYYELALKDPLVAKSQSTVAGQHFHEIKETAIQAANLYSQAYETYPQQDYKTLQADAWYQVFRAASFVSEHGWESLAAKKVRDLLTDELYVEKYQNLVEWREPVKITGLPQDAKLYLFQFAEVTDSFFRLVPAPYSIEKETYREPLAQEWEKPFHLEFSEALVGTGNQEITLKPGSYLFVAKQGEHESRNLLQIVKQANAKPQGKELAMVFPQNLELLKEHVFIPKTSFIAGGNALGVHGHCIGCGQTFLSKSDAAGADVQHVAEAGPFFIQKQEVTFREYLAFLQDLEKQKNLVVFLSQLFEHSKQQNTWSDEQWKNFVLSMCRIEVSKKKYVDIFRRYQKHFNARKALPTKVKGSTKEIELFLRALLPQEKGGSPFAIKNGKVALKSGFWKDYQQKWKAWPVSGVKHYGATLYALWLSKRTNRAYRLPTEQEWELAARGVDGRAYSWGSLLWQGYKPNLGVKTRKITDQDILQESFDYSPWGVADMCGSVGEWTSSEYFSYVFYKKRFTVKGNFSKLLSGSEPGLKCASRVGKKADYNHLSIGFRLALEVEK